MNYYAEYCPYGINTTSDCDILMIFETKAERDAMVERINEADPYIVEGRARAILRKDAASLYRLQDVDNGCMREVKGLRTCAGRCFFEVGNKRGGALY